MLKNKRILKFIIFFSVLFLLNFNVMISASASNYTIPCEHEIVLVNTENNDAQENESEKDISENQEAKDEENNSEKRKNDEKKRKKVWNIMLWVGSGVCLLIAVLLAIRSGNKKYGK